MTSISEALMIVNSDLDAERNEQRRDFTHEKKWNLESCTSTIEKINIIGKTDVDISLQLRSQSHSYSNSADPKEEDREHVKNFEQVFTLFSANTKLLGVEMTYAWKPEKQIMFCFSIFLTLFTWLCIFYTQFIHINNGEILRFLEACAIYGIASSCAQKILGYLAKRYQILSLFFCIRKICRQTLSGSRADILKSELLKTLNFLKMYAVGVASSLGLFVVCPFKSYFVDNELTSLLPLEIVFVNQSTNLGFAIANAVMTAMGMFATLGTVLYGAIFVFAILMYDLQVKLIEQDFKDLDDFWAEHSTVSLTYKQSFLKNICSKQQDIKNFISTIRNIFERKFSFYFCFNYFSQIICLFEITKNQWLPGYAIAMGLFIEMMFYCVMGSRITITDDKLCSIIYATDWYKYDLSSQKMMMLLLHRSQQLNELQLGPLGPLTVQTGIEIVKSIYSYYTILTELL